MRIPKTIKLYINGKFPRTESGKSFPVAARNGGVFANLCDSTRKDLRQAVDAARTALGGWSGKSAYNRAQILYRMAEMCSSREEEIMETLMEAGGLAEESARKEAELARDAFVYYAGFADKYQQLIGSVNPVSGPHHNFTTAEPMGVVAFVPSEKTSYSEFASQLAGILTSGNTVVAVMPGSLGPLLAPLSEVFATSDLPDGVVNLLTESKGELFRHMASHMEIQALAAQDKAIYLEARKLGVDNMKRLVPPRSEMRHLERVLDFVEFKTVWHPIGM